jgi:hypothetical protein
MVFCLLKLFIGLGLFWVVFCWWEMVLKLLNGENFGGAVCSLFHIQPASFFCCRTQNTVACIVRWKMMSKQDHAIIKQIKKQKTQRKLLKNKFKN